MTNLITKAVIGAVVGGAVAVGFEVVSSDYIQSRLVVIGAIAGGLSVITSNFNLNSSNEPESPIKALERRLSDPSLPTNEAIAIADRIATLQAQSDTHNRVITEL